MNYIVSYDDPDLDSPSFGCCNSFDKAVEIYYNMCDRFYRIGHRCHIYLCEYDGFKVNTLMYCLVNPHTGGNCDDN